MSNITDLNIINELYRICNHYMQISERSIDAINNVAEELVNKDKLSMDDIEAISKIRYINRIADCTVDYAVLKPELIEKLNKKLSDHFPEGYHDPFDE